MIFDIFENFGIIQMLRTFPGKVDFWATFASNSGLVKWSFAGITVLMALCGLIGWAIKSFKNQ